MTRLARVFWPIALIDAVVLVVLLVMTLQQRPVQNDGGREMGLFFFVLLPGIVLAIVMLLFHFSTSMTAKWLALVIAVVPGLYFAKSQIEGKLSDRTIEANRIGVGYFDSEPMRQMGAAVVKRDVETLMRIGPTVDVNAPGREMTLMRLAVSSSDARTSDGSELPVVRALLALGANADAAMHDACIRRDSTLLKTLLVAGGNPNLQVTPLQPLVFEALSSITPGNFRLLAEHGLDLNSKLRDDPLAVQLAIYRRWDLLAIAIELGADTNLARPDGRNVANELASQADEEKTAGREVPADLQRARAALGASHAKR